LTLVDTSVWIEHLRAPCRELVELLEQGQVLGHPFVLGELACGSLRNRQEVLENVELLPAATLATHDEVMTTVELHSLYGRGLGWVDVHLLSSALVSKADLWTFDRPLRSAWAHVRSRMPADG
jgi:hypothetical protein